MKNAVSKKSFVTLVNCDIELECAESGVFISHYTSIVSRFKEVNRREVSMLEKLQSLTLEHTLSRLDERKLIECFTEFTYRASWQTLARKLLKTNLSTQQCKTIKRSVQLHGNVWRLLLNQLQPDLAQSLAEKYSDIGELYEEMKRTKRARVVHDDLRATKRLKQ